MHYVALVSCAALLLYAFMIGKVGQSRGKYGVSAPATTGHESFERMFRVQCNTGEQLILFLPALWLFAYFVSANWASVIGVVFIIGRIIYYQGYVSDPKGRALGMVLTFFPSIIMVVGALIAVIMQLF